MLIAHLSPRFAALFSGDRTSSGGYFGKRYRYILNIFERY
jgi:hypothetical protein